MSDYNVRKTIGKPLDEITRDFFDDSDSCVNDGWFTGKVINNNDPDKEGKCRIRVYGIFGDDIPDTDLPWALPDFNFIGSKLGSFVVPPVDALVKVYFDHGDVYLPHYSTKAVVQKSLPKRRMKNYPNNVVFFETDAGDYMEIDRDSSVTTFHHKSGTEIRIQSNGSIIIDCKGKIFSAKGAKNCEIYGTESTNLGGNFPVIYSTTGGIPTDAEGRPIQGIAVSNSVTVGP